MNKFDFGYVQNRLFKFLPVQWAFPLWWGKAAMTIMPTEYHLDYLRYKSKAYRRK